MKINNANPVTLCRAIRKMGLAAALLALLALLATACGAPQATAVPAPSAVPPTTTAAALAATPADPRPAATSQTPPPRPDNPLAGSTWLLERLGEATPVPQTPATLEFGTDGRAAGDAGCNEYGGDYTVVQGQLRFGPLESSAMDCGRGDVWQQEQALLNALAAAESYTLDGDRLTITHPGGELLFRRLEGLEAIVPEEAAGPLTQADLVRALESVGATVAIPTEAEQSEPAADLFSVTAQQVYLNGDVLLIYEYESEAAAAADAARVSASGYGISPPPGTAVQGPTILEWTAVPHFYRWANLIAIYLGDDATTLGALQAVAGPPFAGPA